LDVFLQKHLFKILPRLIILYQWPQLEQLEDAQLPQDEDELDDLTVSPPLPLLKKPHADISLFTLSLLQEGQFFGLSLPKTRYSKSLLQLLQ
jgi:hypothetical protein